MSRIVLVSNRVSDLESAVQAGGVSVAIADMMLNRRAIWFGWNGQIVEQPADDLKLDLETVGPSAFATTALSTEEYRDFYLGYSNSVLWPVFHNRLDLAQFEAGYFAEYVRVNKRYAKLLASLLKPDDVIWIHDYQFITMARELRHLGVRNAIGFFLHIPVPPAQAFLAIPEHIELALALAEFNVIGLQTELDVGNLLDVLQQSVGGQLLPDGRVRVGQRCVTLASLPVGIDAADFAGGSLPAAVKADDVEFRMIGIDRLDYTKGLPHKFRAFGQLLEHNPEWRRRVVLSQIAPPTRETLEAYADIRSELESLAGAINGAYSDVDWAPIIYIHRAVARDQLVGIYRSSRVGVVTPLRDGMNLVAKEYVAAQDPADPGVLILSQFAGAAERMKDALIVNPYNISETADAMKTALEMPLSERIRRHRALLGTVNQQGNRHWSDTFLQMLTSAGAPDPALIEEGCGKLKQMRDMLQQRFVQVV
jgi:trehalose 6-phosphate synthase